MMESVDHNKYASHGETTRFHQLAFGKPTIVSTLAISYIGHFKQVQVKITIL